MRRSVNRTAKARPLLLRRTSLCRADHMPPDGKAPHGYRRLAAKPRPRALPSGVPRERREQRTLANLTADDLRGLGVTSVGHRRQMLEAIAALRLETTPAGDPVRSPPSSSASPTESLAETRGERRRLGSPSRSAAPSQRRCPDRPRSSNAPFLLTIYGISRPIEHCGFICIRHEMTGRLCECYPTGGNPMSLDPNRLILTGENPFIRLSETDGGTITTNASFWRVLISPAGAGHVLYLKSDFTQDRWKIYSDNIAMARWLPEDRPGHAQRRTIGHLNSGDRRGVRQSGRCARFLDRAGGIARRESCAYLV